MCSKFSNVLLEIAESKETFDIYEFIMNVFDEKTGKLPFMLIVFINKLGEDVQWKLNYYATLAFGKNGPIIHFLIEGY